MDTYCRSSIKAENLGSLGQPPLVRCLLLADACRLQLGVQWGQSKSLSVSPTIVGHVHHIILGWALGHPPLPPLLHIQGPAESSANHTTRTRTTDLLLNLVACSSGFFFLSFNPLWFLNISVLILVLSVSRFPLTPRPSPLFQSPSRLLSSSPRPVQHCFQRRKRHARATPQTSHEKRQTTQSIYNLALSLPIPIPIPIPLLGTK